MSELGQKLKTAAWIALVVLVLASPRIAWHLQKAKTLDVVVVDKTVPFPKYREHAGVPWILHTMKLLPSNGKFLDAESGYVGFDPDTRTGVDLTAAHLAKADVLVIADTYGVYAGDYERPGEQAALERSPRIYGGLTDDEATAIEGFVSRGGLLIGEFNSFASPTEPGPRQKMERLFGVRWTRWVGRYWPNLQDANEVPKWVGRVWQKVTHTPFDMKGGGLVLVREDEDIEVLRDGEDFEGRALLQERTAAGAALGLPERGNFRFWLDIVAPSDGEVLYEHVINTTQAGTYKLARHGLGNRFPALTKNKDAWYLAGDFVDTTVELGNPEQYGLLRWRALTAGFGAATAPDDGFFWDFYAPIVSKLFASRAH